MVSGSADRTLKVSIHLSMKNRWTEVRAMDVGLVNEVVFTFYDIFRQEILLRIYRMNEDFIRMKEHIKNCD